MAEFRKYDPVKRREYYLRTRELKGRSSRGKSNTHKPLSSEEYAKTLKPLTDKLQKLAREGKTNTPEYKLIMDTYLRLMAAHSKKLAQIGIKEKQDA